MSTTAEIRVRHFFRNPRCSALHSLPRVPSERCSTAWTRARRCEGRVCSWRASSGPRTPPCARFSARYASSMENRNSKKPRQQPAWTPTRATTPPRRARVATVRSRHTRDASPSRTKASRGSDTTDLAPATAPSQSTNQRPRDNSRVNLALTLLRVIPWRHSRRWWAVATCPRRRSNRASTSSRYRRAAPRRHPRSRLPSRPSAKQP